MRKCYARKIYNAMVNSTTGEVRPVQNLRTLYGRAAVPTLIGTLHLGGAKSNDSRQHIEEGSSMRGVAAHWRCGHMDGSMIYGISNPSVQFLFRQNNMPGLYSARTDGSTEAGLLPAANKQMGLFRRNDTILLIG